MFANVFACLVHESQPCIIDLIRNLRCCDPDSTIVLYDGSPSGEILRNFPFERYGAMIHPSPRPMKWGRLHEFAISCMQYCLSSFRFDSITIVDSDQLLLRNGYSEFLRDHIGQDQSIGMFVTNTHLQGPNTSIGPCQSAFAELELWRPFLQCLPDGEEHFVHWTFWPGTVFIENAVRDLVDRFQKDKLLKSIMERSQMWATEEVIFPTLTALLGYRLAQNPCDNNYLRYGSSFDPGDVVSASADDRCFWIHPVARQYGDPVRCAIREATGHFAGLNLEFAATPGHVDSLTASVLRNIEPIQGWLSSKEAALLAKHCRDVLRDIDGEWNLVEIGSYHGRSTTAIATIIRHFRSNRKLFAVDPHEGEVGSLDSAVIRLPSSAASFSHNLRIRGLDRHVKPLHLRTQDLEWKLPVGFLFIDGLHDYPSVAHDFFVFDPWLVLGGIAVFHDYSASYPGVVTFVNELINNDAYQILDQADTLVVCQKRRITSADLRRRCQLHWSHATTTAPPWPLISCILPTYDRGPFVQKAIECYMEQDYNNRELIVVDDGHEPLQWSLPVGDGVIYVRLDGRHSIGTKRNIGCEAARGEYIAHWDDDDWYAPWRLSTQLSELLRSGADVSGASRLTYHDIDNDRWWRYENPHQSLQWVHGATLFYRKSYWEEHRFEDISIGEDSLFVRHCARSKLLKLNESSYYVGAIHAGNSSYKNTKEPCWRGPLASRF